MTNRTAVLNELIRVFGYRRYLEIGCEYDVNFREITAPYKIGVDPARGGTLRMTSDQFFAAYPDERFDLVFIDGLHLAEQVERDIDNALARIEPGGCVVVHDCLPLVREHQERENTLGAWTGDVWKAFARVRSRPDLDAAVLNADWGIGIIWKRPNSSTATLPEELTWEVFRAMSSDLLRVLEAEEFAAFNRPTCRMAAITCTADRPESFALCRRYVERQTIPPESWIVKDSASPDIWESFRVNMLAGISRALEAGATAIAFIEDDDWYHPAYLARAGAAMAEGFDVWGSSAFRAWNVAGRKWRSIKGEHAATCQTVVSPSAAQQLYDMIAGHGAPAIDYRFWRESRGRKHLADVDGLHIAIKGMHTLALAGWHDPARLRPCDWQDDDDGNQLREWAGDDSLAYLNWNLPADYRTDWATVWAVKQMGEA